MSALPAEPTLADVLKEVWAARRFVIAGALAGIAAGFLFLFSAVPHYRVTMLAAPAERAPKADIKALLPDNPSFALQYLVNTVGSQDSSDFMRFENTLRGPSVAATLYSDKDIIAGLAKTGRFRFSPAPDVRTAAELSALLEDEVKILPVGNTPLRRIIIDHPDSKFAATLLHRLYAETDRMIRREVADKAQKRRAYLKVMMEKVTHPDHRRALTSLLMEQEHILMLLAMEEPFAAIIAEPPAVSVRPVWPRRSLILAGFAFAGMVAGFAVRGSGRGR